MQTLKKQSQKTITITQEEYDILVEKAEITSEYIKGDYSSFDSANDLIKNLKSL